MAILVGQVLRAARMKFEVITEENYPAVSKIYAEGIRTGIATFETSAPTWDAWDKDHLEFARIILFDGKDAVGWASLAGVSSRCVYGGVAEVSIYVGSDSRGRGVGSKLLTELIRRSEENGIWSLQAGIMPENVGSINLHLKCGFRKIGIKEKIAKLNGEWHDNLLMERRSKKVGI